MRCPRIKMQGSAGFNPQTGELRYPDRPGSVHFGAEFWPTPARDRDTKDVIIFSDCTPTRTHWGHHALCALADDILAVETATNYQYNSELAIEDWNVHPMKLEFDEIAEVLSTFLPREYDWQHIRSTSKSFVAALTLQHENAIRYKVFKEVIEQSLNGKFLATDVLGGEEQIYTVQRPFTDGDGWWLISSFGHLTMSLNVRNPRLIEPA